MKRTSHLLFAFLLNFSINTITAQTGFQNMKARVEKEVERGIPHRFTLTINPKKAFLASFLMNKDVNISQTDARQWISRELNLRAGIDQLSIAGDINKTGAMDVMKFNQYFKNTRVEHGMINIGVMNGKLALANMEFYSIDDNFSVLPVLSEAGALIKAMKYINAQKYVWDDYTGANPLLQKPHGELVIIKDYLYAQDTVCLAYKFVILAENPFSSNTIYINANSGAVPLMNSNINDLDKKFNTNLISEDKKTGYDNASLSSSSQNSPLTSTNTQTTAPTRYSGTQNIFTNHIPATNSYTLLQNWNGIDIEVKNYGNRDQGTISNDALATPITGVNNNWIGNDVTATEVSFNMKLVTDYWKDIHNVIGWDNANSPINCYVHAGINYENAFWDGNEHKMYFGDGINKPFVSLDICGHEFGHAVNNKLIGGTGFINQWESGALQEGFADIWGICTENYGNKNIALLNKDIWKNLDEIFPLNIHNEISGSSGPLKDFINPKNTNWPDTYYGTNWKKSNADDCPVPDKDINDNCEVHSNSAILPKWFSLLSIGGTGTNDHNYNYTVSPVGIGVADTIAFNTLSLLTPSSDFTAAMNVSVNYVNANYTGQPNILAQVLAAWRAVGLLDTILFTNPAVPDFPTNNSFSCIGVGKGGHVWAGTSRLGLFKYNGFTWKKCDVNASTVNKLSYRDIKADRDGGIWFAQAGYPVTGASNASGGVDYYGDSTFSSRRHYISDFSSTPFFTTTTLPVTRNVTSIFVDTTTYNWDAFVNYGKKNPKVWTASLAMTTDDQFFTTETSGGLALGLYDSTSTEVVDSNFIKIAESYSLIADKYATQRGAQTVGGNSKEIWCFSDANYQTSLSSWGISYSGTPTQITRYKSGNTRYYNYSAIPDDHDNGDSLSVLNYITAPNIFDTVFTAKAIYFDKFNNRWVGLANKGVRVQDKNNISPTGNWHNLNLISTLNNIFPAGTIVSNNAITGDNEGIVYIGTNNGLVVYTGKTPADLDDPKSYVRYSTLDGLPNNTIRGIAVDTLRKGVWLATDNGIILWRKRGPENLTGITNIRTSCLGNQIYFDLKVKGKYNPSNNIIVELSDASGNFNSPTQVATLAINNKKDTTLSYYYPINLPNGAGYKLRGRSTDPAITGSLSRPINLSRNITTVPSNGPEVLIANRECKDSLGWTNYYYDNHTPTENDDTLLLSIFKRDNIIGTIGDGVFEVKVASTSLAGQNNARLITVIDNVPLLHPFVSMNRYWHVTATTQPDPLKPVNVRFYYNSQDLNDVNGNSFYTPIPHESLVFFKTSNGNPNPDSNFAGSSDFASYVNGPAPGLTTWKYTQITGDIHRAEFIADHFSGGGGGSTQDGTAVILPVQLLSFEAHLDYNKTILNWSTSAEINTDHFEVQRSGDGNQFTGFSKIQAAGNSNTQKIYRSVDEHPLTGKNYYRIKMVDKDGNLQYSSIKLIIVHIRNGSVNIYPTPAKSTINIEGSFVSPVVDISIFDIAGKLVSQQKKANASVIQISVNGLATGTYIIRTNDGRKINNSKFIKE
ncbi:MAG: M4 family metallopeptidase [Ferruginibacter sp.]